MQRFHSSFRQKIIQILAPSQSSIYAREKVHFDIHMVLIGIIILQSVDKIMFVVVIVKDWKTNK